MVNHISDAFKDDAADREPPLEILVWRESLEIDTDQSCSEMRATI